MADGDPTTGAALFAFDSLIRGAGHRLEPATESPADELAATFVEECVKDMRGAWGDTLSDILTVFVYGFSLFEVVYKLRSGPSLDVKSSMYTDGRIGWDVWSIRSQETIAHWIFDDDTGDVTAAVQVAPPKHRPVTIPLSRCLHFRVRARRNSPEGTSLLRNMYEPWYYYKNLQRIEAIALERSGAGFPVARIPADIIVDGNAAFESYKTMVRSIKVDEQMGAVIPSDTYDGTSVRQYDLEFVTTGGAAQFNMDPVLARYERLKLRALLADFLTMGDTGVGSYSQSVNRTDLFASAVNALLDSVADVINVQAIRPLFAINGMPLESCPTFVFNEVSKRDITGFAATLVSLVNAGLVDAADPDLKQFVYDYVGLPAPAEIDAQAQAETTANPVDEQAPTKDEPIPPAKEPNKATEPDQIEKAVAAFKRWVPEKFADLISAEVTA